MKRFRALLLTAIIFPVILLAAAPAGDVEQAVKGNNALGVDLYKQLAKKPGNIVFSPYSLSTALAMTFAGARGPTAKEMAKVLHFTLPPDQLHPAMSALITDLQNRGNDAGSELVIANRLWGQKGYPFADAFLATVKSNYGAELARVDFKAAPDDALLAINAWAAEQTKGKIPEVLAPGSVDPTDRLALVNAVYFKGAWAHKFDPDDTRAEGSFFLASGKEIQTPMMWQETVFGYGRGPGLALLELPYRSAGLAMIVILPDNKNGLPDVEKKLTAANLEKWLADMGRADVSVILPRFVISSELDLVEVLGALGLKNPFTGQADFTGIAVPADEPPLFLGAAVQKAFIEVNEEGTEAAAVTDIGMRMANGGEHFEADHPFLYLIRDTSAGTILFMGRVTDPRGEQREGKE